MLYGICCPKFSSFGVVVRLLFQLLPPQESCVLVATVEISLDETNPTDWPYHGCRNVCCWEDGLKSCAVPDVWSRADIIAKLWARALIESHIQVVSPNVWRSSCGWWQIETYFNTVWYQEPHHTIMWSPRIMHDCPRISWKYTSRSGMGVEQNGASSGSWMLATWWNEWSTHAWHVNVCTQLPWIRRWSTCRQKDVCRMWDHSHTLVWISSGRSTSKSVDHKWKDTAVCLPVSAPEQFILKQPSVSILMHLSTHLSDLFPEEAPLRRFGQTMRRIL